MTALDPQPNESAMDSEYVLSQESRKSSWLEWLQGDKRYYLLVFVGCWLGGVFDGLDSTLMSVAMPAALTELLGTTDKSAISRVASYVGCVFLLGWMAGGILFGVIGDRLGRVRAMVLSILLYAVFTGLAGLAQTWEQLAVCRFLTGLGIGGELVSIATFLTEVWPQRSRAVAIGILITSYQAGVFLAGSINTLFDSWRLVFFVGALPALLVIFLRLTMRESDRWMAARERTLEAEAAQRHPASQVQRLFQAEHWRSLLVGGLSFAGLLVGYWASLSWIPLWLNDILPVGSDSAGVIGTAVMCQGLAAVLGCSLAGVAANRIGRRWTIALSCAGCFAASVWMFLGNPVFSTAVYGQGALLGFFVGMAQAAMYIYLPELFPTLLRASGTGFCLNAGRLTTAVAVLFVADLVRLVLHYNLGDVLFARSELSAFAVASVLFAGFYLLASVAALFGVETRGRALPD